MDPPEPLQQLERHAQQFIEHALTAANSPDVADAYVVSLWVNDEADDPACPTALIGYNTEARVSETTAQASSEREARWNFAFWLQNDLGMLCDPDSDPEGTELRNQWVEGGYVELDDDTDPRFVTRQFVAMLQRVVLALHRDGLVQRVFGRPIPVLIHELEYYDQIAEQNLRSNPDGLARPFADWVLDSTS